MNNINSKEKEVLVVGGGIGGITAALELASCDVHVTMLEQTASIGGRMIQLDKTFPTLDCSTCTLSPKMVEVALNKKVDLLSWSKLLSIKRNGRGFTASILKKSRFVDINKCTACGSCFEGCPVVMKSEFNMNIGPRKAIYISFPQSIPNKAVIDKREDRPCKAACIDTCPIHTNVLGYLKHISEGRFKDAYMLIRATNPLPSTCGRICFAPCEKECNRGQLDQPLAIRDLKRFATDQFNIEELEIPQVTKTGRKVAVIGAGPAGLSAAHDLAVEGHDVTVFEALPEPGGMIRYAIPDYRLPKDLVKNEIGYIKKLGVDIKCGIQVTKESFEDIRKNYDAIFIAVGASKSRKLGVENEDAKGIIGGIDFLKSVNSGEPVKMGETLFVIGGGNVAVDVALTAKRCGVAEVHMVSLEKREEMPAHQSEVEQAIAEGVIIHNSLGPKRFKESNGSVTGMEFKACTAVFDANGRFNPTYDDSCIEGFDADMVIVSIGQAIDTEFVKSAEQIETLRDGKIKSDSRTYETSMKGIFSGGDVVTGPSYVINAIAAGKRAAVSISRYLKGEELIDTDALWPKTPEKLSSEEVANLKNRFNEINRIPMPELPVEERAGNFREVATGYTAEVAMKEASRCLAGQIEGCMQCRECERRCAIGAVDYKMKDEIIDMQFDSIVVAPGFDLYDPTEKGEYGYGSIDGVIMGMEFERMCSVTGPTGGDILFKGKTPKRFFFIQCVGSRDRQSGARFCSRVCCMYTAKHASIVRDRIKDAEIYISYIDVRAYGKNYEEFYKSTQENGILYIRGIPGEVTKTENGLLVRVEDMLSGEMREIEVDLVILATGVRPRKESEELCRIMSLDRDEYGFIKTDSIDPSETNAEGIFACGMGSGPKDVPDTVASGGEAAARCVEYMNAK